jgi:hypothetical protein
MMRDGRHDADPEIEEATVQVIRRRPCQRWSLTTLAERRALYVELSEGITGIPEVSVTVSPA